MKIISKKISLEPYKSRINGSLTSYNGCDTSVTFPNYDVKSQHHNYGMFPYDVIYDGKVLSYPTLMERYYFCKRYKELLKYDSCSGEQVYADAKEYYKHNVEYKTELKYKEYIDLYNTYIEYGGDAFLTWCNSILYGGTATYSNYSGENEPNICGNIDNTAHILIPILFTNTIDDMGEYSIFCEDWEEGVSYNQGNIAIYDDKVWVKNSTDYGSIFSEKYKEFYFPQIKDLKHDYNNQWFKKTGDANITYSQTQWEDYTDLYFSLDENGIPHNETYYTKTINCNGNIGYNIKPMTCSAYNYTNDCCEGFKEVETYSVKNGKIFYNADPKKDMSDKYEITTNDLGFYVIDGIIHEVFKSEYVEYNDELSLVYEADNFYQLNVKYCYIKGQKIYSKTKLDANGKVIHYFLFKEVDANLPNYEETTISKGDFILHNEYPIKLSDGNTKLVINNFTYNKIDGYVKINGITYYIKKKIKEGKNTYNIITFNLNDNLEYVINDSLITTLGKEITETPTSNSSGYSISDKIIYVYRPYNVFSINKMSGYTESKLSSFKSSIYTFDDMGNKLPGSLQRNSSGGFNNISEGYELDLPYVVGTVTDLTAMEFNNDGSVKTFFGNKLASITFYYIDYYGNIINDTKTECSEGASLREEIDKCKDKLTEFKSLHLIDKDDNYIAENHYSINENMKCNIKYHMGCLMDSGHTVIENNSGVTYEEETTIVKKTWEYHIDDVSSYIVYYYDFIYNETYDVLNEYSNKTTKIGKSYFSYNIDDLINPPSPYRAKYDGMIAAPVFREEYKFGSSMKENIESNIYIDRGFSSSFEKHLKMLDVKSMESLENLGNGFYNIIES